jgi:hypothetical protein
MYRVSHIFITLSLFLNSFQLSAQVDSVPAKKYKRIALITGSAVFATSSLLYLNQVWFAPYNNGKFHFFNDNAEWLQMDKVGHVWTTYNTGRLMMDAFDWAGFSKKQKLIFGGTIGFVYMTGVELMDGYSSGWGFSGGDMMANAIGSGLAISQEAMWNEQRVFIKYSYKESELAIYNPSLLGKNIQEKILKDYNAQTYWLSFSPFAFVKGDHKLPKWLAISFGYGATGMLRARENFVTITTSTSPLVEYTYSSERIRNYYVSLDIDFTKIKTKSKTLKAIFSCLNLVKVPAPALGFNKKGNSFNWLR